jgi:hypothetical protein
MGVSKASTFRSERTPRRCDRRMIRGKRLALVAVAALSSPSPTACCPPPLAASMTWLAAAPGTRLWSEVMTDPPSASVRESSRNMPRRPGLDDLGHGRAGLAGPQSEVGLVLDLLQPSDRQARSGVPVQHEPAGPWSATWRRPRPGHRRRRQGGRAHRLGGSRWPRIWRLPRPAGPLDARRWRRCRALPAAARRRQWTAGPAAEDATSYGCRHDSQHGHGHQRCGAVRPSLSGSMHRWFPAVVTGSPISVSKRPSSCKNLVGAGGFEPPASRL